MAQPYSTALQVEDKDISRFTTQAGWGDVDVEERIQEGDTRIDACLKALGYTLPFGATNPALVTQLSKLYGRYAVLRDIFKNFKQGQGVSEGERYKNEFDGIITDLKDGKLVLVDENDEQVPVTKTNTRILTNTDDVHRSMTMGDPTGEGLDKTYDDRKVTGDPSDAKEGF